MTQETQFVFLFTDVEGSTRLWERHPAAMREAMQRHDELLRTAVQRHGGRVVKMSGDGIHAVFLLAAPALAAAVDIQLSLREPLAGLELKVRSALHAGPAEERDGDYFGTTVNRAARLAAAAHGGQILVSDQIRELIGDAMAEIAPLSLRTLGIVRLRDLSAAEPVHQLRHPELPDDFPPLRAMASHPNNLPHTLNAFIGRRRELEAIDDSFRRARLVTLTGPGGIGKSRLALQAAARLIDRFTDGVWLVELAPLTDADALVSTIATVIGVNEVRGQALADTLGANLAGRRALILLDNCEHLIDACAQLVDRFLRAAPHLNILATSRETLNIDGEAVLQVPSLPMPDPDFPSGLDALLAIDAARLFVDRANLVNPDFNPRESDMATLARVLYRLDGIPLAIELAAARMRDLTLADIDRGLDDRFGLLTTGSRVAPPRHKTLRALVDWSYELLTPDERCLFDRLSVFSGGCRLDAAIAVCAHSPLTSSALPRLMASLVDKSLVLRYGAPGAERHGQLETLRQYAVERLEATGSTRELRDRHARWLCKLCEHLGLWTREADQVAWHGRLREESDNARLALNYLEKSADTEQERALRPAFIICSVLTDYWYRRGPYSEGAEWAARVLNLLDRAPGNVKELVPKADVARLHYALARFCYMQADYSRAEVHASASEQLYRELGLGAELGRALAARGHIRFVQYGHHASRGLMEEALAMMIAQGAAPELVLHDYTNLATNASYAGAYEDAARYVEEASRTLGDRVDLARSASWMEYQGIAALHAGDAPAAIRALEATLALHASGAGVSGRLAVPHFLLGTAHWLRGDGAAALSYHQSSLREILPYGSNLEMVNAFESLTAILAESGAAALACRFLGAAVAERRRMGFHAGAQARNVHRRIEEALADSPERDHHARWRQTGEALPMKSAVEEALALTPDSIGPRRPAHLQLGHVEPTASLS